MFVVLDNEHSNIHSRVVSYHDEEETDYSEEVLVVQITNAVVQPATVMVETTDASIALPTVLSPTAHMSLTNFTEEFISCVVKPLSRRLKQKTYPLASAKRYA